MNLNQAGRKLALAIMLGLLFAGSAAAQSIADEVNAGLPSWLQFGGSFRTRFEGFLDRGFKPGENDLHLLNRLRIDLRLRATRWLQFMFESQDARIYFERNVRPILLPSPIRWIYGWGICNSAIGTGARSVFALGARI